MDISASLKDLRAHLQQEEPTMFKTTYLAATPRSVATVWRVERQNWTSALQRSVWRHPLDAAACRATTALLLRQGEKSAFFSIGSRYRTHHRRGRA